MEIDQITGAIVDASMRIHTALGPGLLESVYEACLKHELSKKQYEVRSQVWLPVVYDGMQFDSGYKIDLLVEDLVIVELKVVERFLDVHQAQLLSYLKLSRKPVGLLINFQCRPPAAWDQKNDQSPSESSASSVAVGRT